MPRAPKPLSLASLACIFVMAGGALVACNPNADSTIAQSSSTSMLQASISAPFESPTAVTSSSTRQDMPASAVNDRPAASSSQPSETASSDASSKQSSEPPAPLGDPESLGADIMGSRFAEAQAMAALFEERGVPYPDIYADAGAPTILDFCELCIEEAEGEGVRPEVLFAQAMHETGWLQFGGQVAPEQNNFGGIGALTSGGEGAFFPDVRTGLRAQVQHLKAYASTDELANEVVDPRFDLVSRGVAPTVHDLNGRWAWPGDGYGDAIMGIVEALY